MNDQPPAAEPENPGASAAAPLPAKSPRRRLLVLIGLTLFALILVASAMATIQIGTAKPGGKFNLIASDGRTVTDRTYRGKWELIYFGYSFCPDACPLSLNSITEALSVLGPEADRLQPIFITIDPERDTPAILAQFVANFSPSIVALTGSAADIGAAEKAFGVYAARVNAEDGSKNYFMDHSSFFYLMDPGGRYVATLPVPADGTVLALRLKPYLAENP
jgi:protein SCO1/2